MKAHYSEEDEMEEEEEDEDDEEEMEDLSEVSPSADVEKIIGGGGCKAVYRGRASVDVSHQGIIPSPISNLYYLKEGQWPSRPAFVLRL